MKICQNKNYAIHFFKSFDSDDVVRVVNVGTSNIVYSNYVHEFYHNQKIFGI